MLNSNVYFGKGEYAVTSDNIDRLAKTTTDFIETGVWKWQLVDCLGIKKDGSIAARYNQIIAALSNSEDPKCQALVESMLNVNARVADISHPTARGNAKQTGKQISPAVASKLLEHFTEEEIAQLI